MRKYFTLILLSAFAYQLRAQQTTGLQPFMINHRDATGSPIDLSSLAEKPAGKGGFVSARNGHFYNQSGKRVKLWGVNITDWTRGSVQIPSKPEAEFWAKALSRLGVNAVRLTFLDFFAPRGVIDPTKTDTHHLDAAQMDKLDYWVAQLKKNGIYADLNLMVGRTYKAGDSVQQYNNIGWAKYASYFDRDLIRTQKEFAKALLTHYNPYTKTEYRNEPAIVLVELVNENTLFHAWDIDVLHPAEKPSRDANFKNLSPYHSELLTKLFNNYLNTNKNLDELALLRKQAGVGPKDLIPRIRKSQYQSTPKELFDATVQFYTDVEKNYFTEMRNYLKDTLYLHNMLLGSNDFLHNIPEYPMVESNAVMDTEDGHVYWQHPSWPGKINTPMVNEPDSSTIAKLARTAIYGKPFTVSEVNHAFPNDYEAEGIPLLAAYAAMQDWDAVMWYTFEPKADTLYKASVGDAFDISHHPVKIPQLAAGALMFLRDVSAAHEVVKRNYSKEQIYETMRAPVSEAAYYTPGYPSSNAMKHQVRIGSMNAKGKQTFTPVTDNPLVSDTKQLTWYTSHHTNGFVTVETPRSQALVGFVKANNKSTKNLSAKVDNDFCAITLSSLNNQPISQTTRLLLTTGARTENTGLQWNADRKKATRTGTSPSLIEVVKGNILLKALINASAVSVQPLNGSGKALGQSVAAHKTAAGWQFPIGQVATTWYAISVKH